MTLKAGDFCSFYHDGGFGDNYWAVGWRYGLIIEVPTKGKHLGWMRIEVPVDLPAFDELTGTWGLKPRVKAWIHENAVNTVGDFIFHGQKLREALEERAAAKAEEKTPSALEPERVYVPAPPPTKKGKRCEISSQPKTKAAKKSTFLPPVSTNRSEPPKKISTPSKPPVRSSKSRARNTKASKPTRKSLPALTQTALTTGKDVPKASKKTKTKQRNLF